MNSELNNDNVLNDDDDNAIRLMEALASMPKIGRAFHHQRVWAFVEAACESSNPSSCKLLKAVVSESPGASMMESHLDQYEDRWIGLKHELLAISEALAKWKANIANAGKLFSPLPVGIDVKVPSLEALEMWIQTDLYIAEEQAAIQEKESAATTTTNSSLWSDIGKHIEAGKRLVTLILEELIPMPDDWLAPVLADGDSGEALGFWKIPLSNIAGDVSLDGGNEAVLRIEVFNLATDKNVHLSGGELFFDMHLLTNPDEKCNPVSVLISCGGASHEVTVRKNEPQYLTLNFKPGEPITLQLQ